MAALREATRDLHHACEAHPLGQRMVKGEVTAQEWADWLAAFMALHDVVDPILPQHMARGYLLQADLGRLRTEHGVVGPREPVAAKAFAALLDTETDKLGAAYVLHGAHRKGGPVLRKKLSLIGLPSAHTHYDRPADADRLVNELAALAELAPVAREAFAALLCVMQEIEGRA